MYRGRERQQNEGADNTCLLSPRPGTMSLCLKKSRLSSVTRGKGPACQHQPTDISQHTRGRFYRQARMEPRVQRSAFPRSLWPSSLSHAAGILYSLWLKSNFMSRVKAAHVVCHSECARLRAVTKNVKISMV